MTTIPGARDTGDARTRTEEVRRGVVELLAARGVATSSVESLFGGREWSVTVSGHPDTMTETEVRVAVWTAVLNGTSLQGLPAPAEGIRIHVAR